MEFLIYAAIASTLAQVGTTAQANKENRRAAADEERRRKGEAAVARRSAIRERLITQAELNAGAVTSGTTGSSGYLGANSSIASQFGSNQGFVRGQQKQMQQVASHQQKAANWGTATQNLDALSGMFVQGSNPELWK
jgi:hypothetical protein